MSVLNLNMGKRFAIKVAVAVTDVIISNTNCEMVMQVVEELGKRIRNPNPRHKMFNGKRLSGHGR